MFGRVDWIRTSDLCVPNAALYQAELRPDERKSPNPYLKRLGTGKFNSSCQADRFLSLWECSMKTFICCFLAFVFLGCGEDEPKNKPSTSPKPEATVETVPKEEHERLLAEEESRKLALAEELDQAREGLAEAESELSVKNETIESLELKILELTTAVQTYRKQVKDSKDSLAALRKIGSAEYREIYERAKGLEAGAAILLFEGFLEKYPDSPIASRAKGQIRKLQADLRILQNRKNARTLRTWDVKLKGEGMFARVVDKEVLFELVGRPPDSSKKGSSSEFRQMSYLWKDYVLGQGGDYYDLVIERTDGKVDRILFSK